VKIRLITAAVVAGGLVASMSGAEAAVKTLDGAKTKTLTATFTPTAQDNDSDLVTGLAGGPERVACAAPRCARLPFLYKPAKGVKGPLSFKLTWSVPAEDMDLYVAELDKRGEATELAHCGASAGTSEQLLVDASTFKSGKTYALIADFYRATGSAVTATVSLPGAVTNKAVVPDAVDSLQPTNCGL
jgi:hypothetical protein